jgi:hypothetical protein
MDMRINEVHSQVRVSDSPSLLDPRVLKEIVRACVRAVKEDQAREKRMGEERRLTPGISPEES